MTNIPLSVESDSDETTRETVFRLLIRLEKFAASISTFTLFNQH